VVSNLVKAVFLSSRQPHM